MLTTICFCISAAIAIFGVVIHELIGTPRMLPAVAATQMRPITIGLFTFAWRTDSVLGASIAALFLCAAFLPGNELMAVIASAMSLAISATAVWTAIAHIPRMWRAPPAYVWSLTAAIGAAGIWLQ